MYYLLGYRLMGSSMDVDTKELIAENTYILTLDGDIDFHPKAVKSLLDLMIKNKNLGAVCGRIHPVGKGNSVNALTCKRCNVITKDNTCYIQVLLFGFKNLNMQLDTGFKNQQNM